MGDIAKDINSKFTNPLAKALINIKYTANWISSHENDFFRDYGLSPQQYNILRILRGAAKPIKVQTVKERMIDRAPNATRLMDKLCDKKYISRFRCEKDRRVVYVQINEEGLQLLEKIGLELKFDFVQELSDEEANTLSDLLDKLR